MRRWLSRTVVWGLFDEWKFRRRVLVVDLLGLDSVYMNQ